MRPTSIPTDLNRNGNLPNPLMEIDYSDTEKADKMNIIDNDSDVDSDIDVQD